MLKNLVKDLKPSSTLLINETSRKLEKQGKKIYKFGFGQSPFKVPEDIVNELKDKLDLTNIMQVPSLEKIIISRGVGAAVSDKKLIDHAVEELTLISGQKAIATLSKKDVASFKLRKGTPIGAKVTLRGDRMYEFLDRLITIALPRVRDFQGIKADGFDGRGNYNLGIKEQIIFPEINIDKVNKIAGMDITFVTNTNSNKEAKALLTNLGLPFKK